MWIQKICDVFVLNYKRVVFCVGIFSILIQGVGQVLAKDVRDLQDHIGPII